MQSSSSSGPGIAWTMHLGSRRRSRPLGERAGMAAYRRPLAMTGQNGCSRGPPSGRTVARYATVNTWPSAGRGSPRSSAQMPGHSLAVVAASSGASVTKVDHDVTEQIMSPGHEDRLDLDSAWRSSDPGHIASGDVLDHRAEAGALGPDVEAVRRGGGWG